MKYLLCLWLLVSCAHKVTSDGGQATFDTAVYESLSPQDLPTYAQTVVKRETRDPEGVPLARFRQHPAGQIRKIGLVIFETELQPSRSGLASDRNVYLSVRGKQILTQQLWRIWDRELRRLSSQSVTWVTRDELIGAKSFASAGSTEPDYVLKDLSRLTEEDVFWKNPGQTIPTDSLVQPANYRDLGIVLVPAYELMGGPKPSQHQHHWVNDLCKELELDAVLLVSLGAEWRRGGVDKRTQAVIPEEMKIRSQASIVYPWSRYHTIGESLGEKKLSKLNVPLASYSVNVTVPAKITIPESEESFTTAFENVIVPMRFTARRISTLVLERIVTDIHQTHQGQ